MKKCEARLYTLSFRTMAKVTVRGSKDTLHFPLLEWGLYRVCSGHADGGRGVTQNPASEIEDARLEAVHACAVIGHELDPRFSEASALVCEVFDVPYGMICLVDETQQVPLATVGFATEPAPREGSFGDTIVRSQDLDMLLIADASGDPRFANDPMVAEPMNVRFVAGVPLCSSAGIRLGALLLFDHQPRSFDAAQRSMLTRFGARIVDLLELHRAAAELAHARGHLDSLATLIPICSHCRKVRNEADQWQTLERLVQAKTGSRFTHGICPDCVREHYPDAADDILHGRSRIRR